MPTENSGSGKTLAYLMPLVEDILKRKREWKARMIGGFKTSDQVIDPGYDYARAIILVPNKELAHQAARMAASICGGLDRCVVWGAEALGMDYNRLSTEDIPEEEVVRLALLPGGLSAPQDFPPWRFATSTSPNHQRQPPPDLVFATPANLGPLALSPKHINLFADVSTLVVDEADMLLDGGYIRQLNNVLMGFRRADRLLDKYDSSSFRHNDNDDAIERKGEGEEAATEGQKKTQHVFVAATRKFISLFVSYLFSVFLERRSEPLSVCYVAHLVYEFLAPLCGFKQSPITGSEVLMRT